MDKSHQINSRFNPRQLLKALDWTRASYVLLSSFLVMIFLIMYFWWPLVVDYWALYNPDLPFWRQMDWLLLGIFAFMSLAIMKGADIKVDLPIILAGFAGGFVIELWGTQTEIWTYYTFERPPLWIIPAWPIAALSIERISALLQPAFQRMTDKTIRRLYWGIYAFFFVLMLHFVAPTFGYSMTLLALILSAAIILTPTDHRKSVTLFLAGAGLGYFLELWGTTREAWQYYTLEAPPLFAVLAHGLASVAFWRTVILFKYMNSSILHRFRDRVLDKK